MSESHGPVLPAPPSETAAIPARGTWAFYRMPIMGAIFPITAGIIFYGWRAAGAIALVVLFAAAALRLWRRVGPRGAVIRSSQGIWLALLLALMLPAHLFATAEPPQHAPWLLLASAGLLLAALMWLLGGSSVHPVLVAYLILVSLFGGMLVPRTVLYRDRVLIGDILSAQPQDLAPAALENWTQLRSPDDADAMLMRQSAASYLSWWPGKTHLSLDDLPPLEDVIIGGHPAPIGTGSTIAVIVGGLFLLYRGLIDYRIPLLIALVSGTAFLLLPVPYVVGENGVAWTPLAVTAAGGGWASALTFVNYQLMASPLAFVAFFLATSPAVRPITPHARFLFAVLVGLAAAAAQLYISTAHGAYIALLLVSLVTGLMDRALGARGLLRRG